MEGPIVKPRVLILGAGFAGLAAAKALRRAPVQIRIIDRCNHHLFQPLLYQVATAGLNPGDIASPIRRILRGRTNLEVHLDEVRAIQPSERRVVLASGEAEYDWLIVAMGATHSYFGRDEWERHAPGLKTLEDALRIRERVLKAFESAEREEDESVRRRSLTFVVAGAGPTGVELAGALVELARHTLVGEFRRIDPRHARVVLVEAGDRVLSSFEPPLNAKALAKLEKMGVEVRLKSPVLGVDAGGVDLPDERIEAATVLWACGVAGSPAARSLGAPLDKQGRVFVEPDLSVPGLPNVFVIGDLAHIESAGKIVPGVAPAAMQQGVHCAKNVERSLLGEPTLPFRYVDKGSLATIGRTSATAQFGTLKIEGPIAWFLWAFVHIFFLIGFRNRLIVMIQWAWAYFTYDRAVRLITGRFGAAENRAGSPGGGH